MELQQTLAGILEEARAAVAAGRPPAGFEARIAAAGRAALRGGAEAAVVEREEVAALRRLAQVAAVHRSRALVAREPVRASRPAVLRTTPTISGSLGVRRGEGDDYRLEWDAVPLVTEWEVRFSERADARSDYAEVETRVLPGSATGVEVPLGDGLVRVAIVGRGRGGRLLRRSLISGLSRDGWRDRWQHRA